ncbi:MAG: helix-turn-helix domain-containing protein [Acidimicrobiia bacterium]
MAEAPTLDTLTPKQLGKHLRDVRRRKGLSQSEVARGAGLTRRELNAYEKGRIPIPDSDLFVLAGSCGVDVSELRVPASTPELEAALATDTPAPAVADLPMPSSIEDTVAQLRQSQEVAPPTVPAVTGRRRARAIAAASEPAPAEDDWPIERIDPLEAVRWPGDASIPSPATPTTPSPAEPVDVFEELARLPEPLPLPSDETNDDPFAKSPELVTPPPPGAVEDVDAQPYDEWPTFEADYKSEFEPDDTDEEESESVLVEMPNAQSTVADLTNAADAPPIDVAMRGESYVSPWDALQGPSGFDTPADTPAELPPDIESEPGVTDAWDPVQPTWATPWSEQPPVVATPDTDPAAFGVNENDAWATEAADTVDVATPTEVFDPRFATATPFEAVPGPWAHEPDPEATNTGFYIDWGDAEADAPVAIEPGPASWDPLTPRPVGEPVAEPETEVGRNSVAEVAAEPAEPETDIEVAAHEPELEVELDAVEDIDDELPLISWRPQWDDSPAAAIGAAAFAVDEPSVPEPEPEEQFVVAGTEWVLGNAVPLVEVRSTGSLVMRRADERWALADVTAASDFALETYVDLRSGPGFGLLFRAMIDDDGRMSGYSFDVDPVYEGGSYLVREWRADRELWNPIARVPASDPEAMHGLLAVRLTVDDERLVASVNGETVLEVDSLKQASVDRGREGAFGNRVGIQAWSSTDLVIDELRVAQR